MAVRAVAPARLFGDCVKKYHFIVHTYVYIIIHVIKQMITPKYLC